MKINKRKEKFVVVVLFLTKFSRVLTNCLWFVAKCSSFAVRIIKSTSKP